jgi:hypothetical protein
VISIPWPTAEARPRGVAAGSPLLIPGIHAGDKLLAVLSFITSAGDLQAHDVSDFAVSEGAIESATVDLAGRYCVVLHTRS